MTSHASRAMTITPAATIAIHPAWSVSTVRRYRKSATSLSSVADDLREDGTMTSPTGSSGSPPDPAATSRSGTASDIEPDDKDWTWVLQRPCDECGFDVGTVSGRQVAARLRAHACLLYTSPSPRDGLLSRMPS